MILGFKTKFDDGTPTLFKEKIALSFVNHINELRFPLDYEVPKLIDFADAWTEDYDGKMKAKIHSIRAGKRWKPGMIIHMATGVRTKNYHNFAQVKCVSVQDIKMVWHPKNIELVEIYIDGVDVYNFDVEPDIAINDGLSIDQFCNWFHSASIETKATNIELIYLGCEKQRVFNGQIVHWTNFKY